MKQDAFGKIAKERRTLKPEGRNDTQDRFPVFYAVDSDPGITSGLDELLSGGLIYFIVAIDWPTVGSDPVNRPRQRYIVVSLLPFENVFPSDFTHLTIARLPHRRSLCLVCSNVRGKSPHA